LEREVEQLDVILRGRWGSDRALLEVFDSRVIPFDKQFLM
jgi:hypothetical protein